MLGCIADDYTGATDLSSMLVRAGLRVVQVFGPETNVPVSDVDAVVLSLKSRSIAAADAVAMSLHALRFLQSIGAQRFFFKYCSTFDSTPAGNIGPVAEALGDALGIKQLWYVPSFPENGRTVYCGNLFVNRVPLNESGMKDHPLNPMRDSNLVRVLQAQCKAGVDFLPLDELRSGNTSRLGDGHWIVDAIHDQDLQQIALLARDQILLTGGSAVARFWMEVKARANPAASLSAPLATVILAGSCSIATRQQIEAFKRVLRLDVIAASESEAAFEAVVEEAVSWCLENSPALVASGVDSAAVAATVARLGEKRAAELTESLFARIAKDLAARGVNRIIVAGGETSGAVVNALGIDAIRIGEEIAPGVPCVHTLREPYLSLALKSGNFGGTDFFMDAVRKLN